MPYSHVRGAFGLLRRFDVGLVAAVRPWQLGEVAELVRAAAGEGVPLSLWPMLADEDGRWANARNAPAFGAFVRALCDVLDAARARVGEIALDVEPPIADVRALLGEAGRREGVKASLRAVRDGMRGAGAAYGELVAELGARGVRASAALVPLSLAGGRWHRMMGWPEREAAVEHLSVMLYTSILEGWSRGVFDRQDARALLARGCSSAVRRLGARAGASLGAVGTGALGNEPVYRGVDELADDVAVARAAGLDDLALFDLGGVLRRPPPEAWLEAFVATEPAAELPKPSTRVRAAVFLARLSR